MIDLTTGSIKEEAKRRLKGNWDCAIIMILLTGVISIISSIIRTFVLKDNPIMSLIVSLAVMIITTVLTFGQIKMYIDIVRCKRADLMKSIEFGGTNIVKAIFANIVVGVITIIGFLLLIVPGIIFSFRYIFVLYVIADNPEIDIMEALKQSKELTDGHKMDIFIFQLSFILWIIPVIITLGLASFYVTPYITAATTVYYDRLRMLKYGTTESEEENLNNENYF